MQKSKRRERRRRRRKNTHTLVTNDIGLCKEY
jgi:hypothetical protein